MPNGYIVEADNREEWFRMIAKHAADNNIPLPDSWREYYEDQLCRVLPPGLCLYGDGAKPNATVDTRMSVETMAKGMNVLIGVLTDPDPLVSQELAESRARTCASCVCNVNIHGCASCYAVADAVAHVRGARKTEADSVLRTCACCACHNRAQVWIKPELLKKGVGGKQMDNLRSMEHCWKWKEIDALQE